MMRQSQRTRRGKRSQIEVDQGVVAEGVEVQEDEVDSGVDVVAAAAEVEEEDSKRCTVLSGDLRMRFCAIGNSEKLGLPVYWIPGLGHRSQA